MWTKDEIDEEYSPIDLNWNSIDDAMLCIVLDAKRDYPKNWTACLMRRNVDAYEWLMHRHPLLDGSYNSVTKLYWLMHKLEFFPKCPICGKTKYMHKNIDRFDVGYFRSCCKECAAANPERQKKIANTTEQHFGSRNFFTSTVGKAKIKKYLDDHGVVNAFQIESVKHKSCMSRKAHFGYDYTMQSPEKRALASENYRKKTGYAHQFYDPEVQAKIDKTKSENVAQGIDPRKKFKLNWRVKRYKSIASLSHEVVPLFTLEHFIEFDRKSQYHELFDWHCNKCGKDFKAYLDQNLINRAGLPARCLNCHPIDSGTSRYEFELEEFLSTECGVDVKMHDRSILDPLEIDCVIPSKKIGIEFDGLFFHSEMGGMKDKTYHVFKTDEARRRADYRLIHIFEDEWVNKQAIVKSRLKDILGIYSKRIFARKCIVKKIDRDTSKSFINTNHIQGWCNSKVNYGLYFGSKLVSVMTFGKPRFSKTYDWELLRFCSTLGSHVVGAAGKLLAAFEREFCPKSLLSYADRRWSIGNLYDVLGFKLDHITEPNYWYLKSGVCGRFPRIDFQKHKLKSILSTFDANCTEVENMRNNGYDRIFDCGNFAYVKMYTSSM